MFDITITIHRGTPAVHHAINIPIYFQNEHFKRGFIIGLQTALDDREKWRSEDLMEELRDAVTEGLFNEPTGEQADEAQSCSSVNSLAASSRVSSVRVFNQPVWKRTGLLLWRGECMVFQGFSPIARNYFQMPNEWTDITADIESLAELKIVEYVLRHTWGYHEFGQCKTISIDEFMYGRRRADGSRMDKGTKLSRPSVIDGVKRATEHGYLICAIDTTDQARIKKAYALKMDSGKDLNTSKETLPPSQSSIFTSEVRHLYSSSQVSLPRSEKETLERHFRKKEGAEEHHDPDDHPLSFPPSQNSSLLSSLTEEHAAFWTRWCSVARCKHESLNQTALKHVVELASQVTTTEDVQSLYDYAYDHLRGISEAKGTPLLPPRLGNLVKAYAEWSASRIQKDRKQAEAQARREHISGTGNVRNYTQERLSGASEPMSYKRLDTRPKKTTAQAGRADFDGMLETLRKRVRP